VETSEKK